MHPLPYMLDISNWIASSSSNDSFIQQRINNPKEVHVFLCQLKRGKNLKINWATSSDCIFQLLGCVASSCPDLQVLELGDSVHPGPFHLEAILALLLGDSRDLLPPAVTKDMGHDLHFYQFPQECVSKICKTLRHLSVFGESTIIEENKPSAFLLRHLLAIQFLDVKFNKAKISNSTTHAKVFWLWCRVSRVLELLRCYIV